MLSKFLWQNKKARIRQRQLLCPKERGGLNLSNMKNYYWADQLKALTVWLTKELDRNWVGLEQNYCQGVSLQALPFLTNKT